MKVMRKMDGGRPAFTVDARTLTIINADTSLNGSPDMKNYSSEDIRRAIGKEDMRYNKTS